MKTTNNSDENFLDFGKDYEAHLFEYVLKHVKEDADLDPEIMSAISTNLLHEEFFGKYYLKIKELNEQGLFTDSYTYADFLMKLEDLETNNEGSGKVVELPQKAENRNFFSNEPWINVAAVGSILLVASLLIFQYIDRPDGSDRLADQVIESTDNGVKSLGSESGSSNTLSFTTDDDIKHNSELMANYTDPVFCKMHLVFKGISDKGFIVRSKRRGIGKEDPFKEELEVRFSNSGKRAEVIASLENSLKNREFPEYIVRGLYCKDIEGLNTYQGLPLLTALELIPVEE
ncbi:MAG: hypothetical protein AAFQ94_19550 [Bacteroidota bacterium]